MKKLFFALTFITLIILCFFSLKLNADPLDTINVTTDKTIVNPGTNVKLTINFGKVLGAYTFDINYDNNLFEYVSVDGGTENNTGSKVRVTYYDSTGGSNSRDYMSIIFKAKDGITTSNPTQFTITAEGLANNDASVTYDDITSPITKDVTVEPNYKDYTLSLSYDGKIVKNEEKQIKITTKSEMGKYYDHVRLISKLESPDGANVTIIGKDTDGTEYDLIKDGWGKADGYELGGNVNQELNFTALFSENGKYTLTLQLVDTENSNSVIASETFTIQVGETVANNEETVENENNNTTKPTTLPETGINIYKVAISLVVLFSALYLFFSKKQSM